MACFEHDDDDNDVDIPTNYKETEFKKKRDKKNDVKRKNTLQKCN